MSYREDVTNAILQHPNGARFLYKARDPNASITAEEVLEVFPPEVQDGLFRDDQEVMIEQALARGYTGDRLLEVLPQMHFSGPDILNSSRLDSNAEGSGDDLGTTMYEYGQRFKNYYKEAESKLDAGDEKSRCGASTGQFINPLESGSVNFSRKFSAAGINDPMKGGYSKHDGDDIADPIGAGIVASDGGVVTIGNDPVGPGKPKGYGLWVAIAHANKSETFYAHASKVFVKNGDKVNQGDRIAEVGVTGGTTGPHLHFELKLNGQLVPPSEHVNYGKTAADAKREKTAAASKGDAISN
jgi:murein DD-endopeptidase MepM/ murein hydrolase activator NlpD